MSSIRSHSARSTRVELSLIVAGRVYPLSHVGPDQVTLRDPASVSPGPAELIVAVDGDEDHSLIRLLPPEEGQPQVIRFLGSREFTASAQRGVS